MGGGKRNEERGKKSDAEMSETMAANKAHQK